MSFSAVFKIADGSFSIQANEGDIGYCTDAFDTTCSSARPNPIGDGAWVYAKNSTETDDYFKAKFIYGVGFQNAQKHIPSVPAPGYGSNPALGSTLNISGAVGTNPTTTLTVSETGNATLNVTGVNVTGTDGAKFTFFSPTSISIADGGMPQTATVTCNGSSVGTFSATLNVAHNATGSPATYPLSCVIGDGGGTTPISASVESDLAFVLTFLGIVLFAAFKMRKNKA